MTLILGLLIIAGAVYAVIRRFDVRLVLLCAAFALGVLAGRPAAIVQKFFVTLAGPEFLIPLCSAMGFAHVLRHTGCDQHLVHLLVHPLRRARPVLIPGAVLVGFLVNIPILSQTSAAVAIGSVLIPLLFAARISPITAGAALLLGTSIGGELLNPGAPEFRAVIKESASLGLPPLTSAQCIRAVLPLDLMHLAVATGLFWALSLRAEARHAKRSEVEAEPAEATESRLFRVSLLKAAVPLVPLALLFVVGPPLNLIALPARWLVAPNDPPAAFDSRLIGSAMLVGVAVAALAGRRAAAGVTGAFFQGAGYAMTHIISIIVAAACFGEAVKGIGLDEAIGALIRNWPHILLPAAGFLPMGFSMISGSGSASAQSLIGFFAGPALELGIGPEHVGAVVAIGASAGRTMSLVAAVTLMCASLTGTKPGELVRRVAPPLLAGLTVVVITGMVFRATGRWSAPPVPAAVVLPAQGGSKG